MQIRPATIDRDNAGLDYLEMDPDQTAFAHRYRSSKPPAKGKAIPCRLSRYGFSLNPRLSYPNLRCTAPTNSRSFGSAASIETIQTSARERCHAHEHLY